MLSYKSDTAANEVIAKQSIANTTLKWLPDRHIDCFVLKTQDYRVTMAYIVIII